MKKRKLKVLWLPADDGGCGWYRVRQWNEFMQGRDDVESFMMSGKEEDPLALVEAADIIVGRIQAHAMVKEIKERVDPLKKIVFDHDDNTMEVLPTSEHYKEFGTQDAWVEQDGEVKPVWVTGITEGFNRYENLSAQMGLLYLLGSADLITTPVSKLTSYYMQFASGDCKGAVVPNSINRDMYPKGEFIPEDKGEEIRIGWTGGVSHLGDWYEIKEQLGVVMNKHPEVVLHIQGSYFPSEFNRFGDRVKFHPWVPWKAYPYRLKMLALDGAIIPLENKPFNEFKSEIKFTELSMLGVPCLVKNMLPYSAVVEDGKNAWTYKDGKEFVDKFDDMIKDIKGKRSKSKRFVKAAQRWVEKERDVEKNVDKLIEVYKSILPEEITAQLV